MRRATGPSSGAAQTLGYFYPRSPCGERLGSGDLFIVEYSDFYPRSPCGERLTLFSWQLHTTRISIHALLAESDLASGRVSTIPAEFLSTLSLRRATGAIQRRCADLGLFLSTLSLRRATPGAAGLRKTRNPFLSTLSLRRATGNRRCCFCRFCISIHALLAESDAPRCCRSPSSSDFYPRSPCGERPACFTALLANFIISIHALLAESDPVIRVFYLQWMAFLSTLSLRRATRLPGLYGVIKSISIHALLAESDYVVARQSRDTQNFYPRSPCGERPVNAVKVARQRLISIHALLAESDLDRWLAGLKGTLFLSTLSLRRATIVPAIFFGNGVFLSTLSLRRATTESSSNSPQSRFLSTLSLRRATTGRILRAKLRPISIHALLAESDERCAERERCTRHFYPRSPCGERPG